MKYTFKEFDTGRMTFTLGEFSHWWKGGPMHVWYAVFKNRRSTIHVPEYCLTPETRAKLPFMPGGSLDS